MSMTTYLGTMELARQIGVPYYKIRYGHNVGLIPEPMIVGGKRWYTEDDVKRVREHFKVTNAKADQTDVRGQ